MIRIENGIKTFKTDTVITNALHEINLSVSKGEFLSVVGCSGSGKTTLLNIIGFLDSLSSGRYFFEEVDIATLNYRERVNFRRNNISYIFQSFNLIPSYTIFKNVELPLKYRKVPKIERKCKVEAVLEELNLSHRKNHYPKQLSGGEQQRVAIARATISCPSIILADEPTGNLDSETGDIVLNLLRDLNSRMNSTVIMVTHSEQASKFADRKISMSDGMIL